MERRTPALASFRMDVGLRRNGRRCRCQPIPENRVVFYVKSPWHSDEDAMAKESTNCGACVHVCVGYLDLDL
jgi:hypothetical protein